MEWNETIIAELRGLWAEGIRPRSRPPPGRLQECRGRKGARLVARPAPRRSVRIGPPGTPPAPRAIGPTLAPLSSRPVPAPARAPAVPRPRRPPSHLGVLPPSRPRRPGFRLLLADGRAGRPPYHFCDAAAVHGKPLCRSRPTRLRANSRSARGRCLSAPGLPGRSTLGDAPAGK